MATADIAVSAVGARSWLFVPGDRPDRMAKALASPADAIILDLEDSVAIECKPAARQHVLDFLAAPRTSAEQGRIWVRTGAAEDSDWAGEAAMLVAAGPAGIVLPKAEGRDGIVAAANAIEAFERAAGRPAGTVGLLPILETPAGVMHAMSLGRLPPRVGGLTWGSADLQAALGTASGWTPAERPAALELARSLCLLAAGTTAARPIETLYPRFDDDDGLTRMARRAAADGFAGMIAIHPRQVSLINEAFAPAADDLARARNILAAFEASPGASTVALDGRMLDAPDLAWAARILARARPGSP